MLKFLLLGAALVTSGAALAAPADVTVSRDGRIATFHGTVHNTPELHRSPAHGPAIFSNLGVPYNGTTGWTISATGSALAFQQYVAFGFTPSADAMVGEIDAAVSYVQGTNGATIGLYTSKNGAPGHVLQHRPVKNLQTFGNCCAVAKDRFTNAVRVKSGVQYFVVVELGKNTTNTFDVWNQVTATTALPAATNTGSGWVAVQGGLAPAGGFAVYAKRK